MSRAVRIHQTGGPEVLHIEELEVGRPGAGQILLRHHAVGLNFIDVYHRTGLYPLPLPSGLGTEGAGIVEETGDGVAHLRAGDRVAYATSETGAYCERRVMSAMHVCKLPDGINFDEGAAMMLKGLTAQYLLRRIQPLGGLHPGDHVLFHAAAGGVGLLACQWAKAMGLKLIGTAGSDEKCALARENGAVHVINYRTEDFAARVMEITAGAGVRVVYDSVGKDTWDKSLDCLQPFGLMASFGNSSGPVPAVAIGTLATKGSLFVTRQTLFTHIATRASTQAMADDLFGAVTSGNVRVRVARRYPLADVREAHIDLEARRTTGSTVITM